MTVALSIVGNPDPAHVGAHLLAAATDLGYRVDLVDAREAYAAPRWQQRANWWLRGHRPARIRAFNDALVAHLDRQQPDALLTIGIAPVDAGTLRACRERGVRSLNFLTDDPWNPAHRSPWFLDALPRYDVVITPRHANERDLRGLNGPDVLYLPFAYNPAVHFPEAPAAGDHRFEADVMFAGGADADRVPLLASMIGAGLDVAAYGGYWTRYPSTRGAARGFLDARGLRQAASAARVSLCMGRRANRDDHAMRTYELPAMAACMLVENTPHHRQLFGADGDAVLYFDTIDDAVRRARELLADETRQVRCRRAVRTLITEHSHTYADRLTAMIAGPDHTLDETCSRHTRTLSRV